MKLTDEQIRELGIEIVTAMKADMWNSENEYTMEEIKEYFVLDVVNLTGEWSGIMDYEHGPQIIAKQQERLYEQADFVAKHTIESLNKIIGDES